MSAVDLRKSHDTLLKGGKLLAARAAWLLFSIVIWTLWGIGTLERLGQALVTAVKGTMEPEQVLLWLKRPEDVAR
jgi:hypothetical protein